jgi:tRNA A37 threonylcarbamoyladenosine dehydratase
MGAGGKMEASKVKVADILSIVFSKTIRRRLKEVKIDKLKVVFPLKFKMILV